MKINWGVGIALFYATFMIVLLNLVFQTTQNKHSLVLPNYYEEDLNFQTKLDHLQNGIDKGQQVKITYAAGEHNLLIGFSNVDELIQGTVSFYRPSNSNLDFSKKITLDKLGQMSIPVDQLEKGVWGVQLDWQYNGDHFSKEKRIYLQ